MNRWAFILASVIILVIPASGPVRAAEPIKLAALFNLTGDMASIDRPGLNGAQLMARRINEAGGLLGGRPLEVISIDTKTSTQAAASGARGAVTLDPVAGLGYGDTSFVMVAAPIFQDKGIPFVTSGATHPLLPRWVGDRLFMVAFGDDDQSFAIADFTHKVLKARNIAVWTDESMEFTKALSRFFIQRVEELGGRIVHQDAFRAGLTDFSPLIERLRAVKPAPEAIFVAALPAEAGLSVKQIRTAGLNQPIVSGDGFDTELVTTLPGPALAQGVYFSTHAYREDPRPEVRAFDEAYKRENKQPPNTAFAALGYDAVGLIADALTRAGSTDGQALSRALASTRGYQGVTGKISYTRPSGVPVKTVSIVGVIDGRYQVLSSWRPDQ